MLSGISLFKISRFVLNADKKAHTPTKSLILSIGYNNPVVQTLEPLIANYTTLCSSTMPVPSANMK